MTVRDMANLYVGYNEQEDFRILICAWDEEEAAELAIEYATETGLNGRWEISDDPDAITDARLDCSYVVASESNGRKGLLYDRMLNHISEMVSGSDLVDTLHAIGFTDEEIKAEGLWPENEEDTE